jgi:hypothetical protein
MMQQMFEMVVYAPFLHSAVLRTARQIMTELALFAQMQLHACMMQWFTSMAQMPLFALMPAAEGTAILGFGRLPAAAQMPVQVAVRGALSQITFALQVPAAQAAWIVTVLKQGAMPARQQGFGALAARLPELPAAVMILERTRRLSPAHLAALPAALMMPAVLRAQTACIPQSAMTQGFAMAL